MGWDGGMLQWSLSQGWVGVPGEPVGSGTPLQTGVCWSLGFVLSCWVSGGGREAKLLGMLWTTGSPWHRCDGEVATLGPWWRAGTRPLGSSCPPVSG